MAEQKDAGEKRAKILQAARKYIGTTYDKLDCSHFVHKAYGDAGLSFPYADTDHYSTLLVPKYFVSIELLHLQPGDLLLYPKHVAIFDPAGCAAVHTAECERIDSTTPARILSARSGKNVGVEYGASDWFGKNPSYLCWTEFTMQGDKLTA